MANSVFFVFLIYVFTSISGASLHKVLSDKFGLENFYYPSWLWYGVSLAITAMISGSLMYAVFVEIGTMGKVALVILLTASAFLNSVFFPGINNIAERIVNGYKSIFN